VLMGLPAAAAALLAEISLCQRPLGRVARAPIRAESTSPTRLMSNRSVCFTPAGLEQARASLREKPGVPSSHLRGEKACKEKTPLDGFTLRATS